jgi:hypothetical protein
MHQYPIVQSAEMFDCVRRQRWIIHRHGGPAKFRDCTDG